MAAVPSWLPVILKEQSFLHTHAFWNQYFHNHKAHSVVALARLGASEERVRKHCEWQNERYFIILSKGRRHHKSKTWYQWPYKKDLCPTKIFFKKKKVFYQYANCKLVGVQIYLRLVHKDPLTE